MGVCVFVYNTIMKLENENVKSRIMSGEFLTLLVSCILGTVIIVCFMRFSYWSLNTYPFNNLLSMKRILYL